MASSSTSWSLKFVLFSSNLLNSNLVRSKMSSMRFYKNFPLISCISKISIYYLLSLPPSLRVWLADIIALSGVLKSWAIDAKYKVYILP
jgi:hypothetical protein